MSRRSPSLGLGLLVCLLLGLAFLNLPAALAQQATGTILGAVTDPQGAVIPDASVTATNSDTGFTRTVPTGSDGAYRLPNLPPGNYEVHVTKDGFETNDRKGLVLEVGQDAVVNVAMTVGTTSQTVEVSSSAVPLVDTTDSAVGGVVDEQRVADLPLNGRNWAQLELLQSGVAQSFLTAPSPTGGNGGFGGNGTVFVANGATPRANNYMLDGAYLGTMWGFNGASVTGNNLGIDGIQEFRLVTSLFSAEYAFAGGSQTIIASKGGTNSFHGDAYEYLRNSSLDARNYFDALDSGNVRGFGTNKSEAFPDKRLPPFHRSDYGGAVGGPIRKDKTFFYAVLERLDEHKGLSAIDTTMPSGCFTNGTFDGVISPTLPSTCAPFLTQAQVAALPSTSLPYVNQTPGPNYGQVTITPAIQQILMKSSTGGALNPALFPSGALWPAPNVSLSALVNNYTFPSVQDTSEYYGQLRLDQTFSSKDSAFLRYTHDQAYQFIPSSFTYLAGIQTSIDQFITASESHVFSPTFLQTLRFSLSHTRLGLNTLGLPGDNQESLVYQNGPGSISPGSGVTAPSIIQPSNYYQDVLTTSDDYIWTKGKHSFKIGGLWGHWANPNAGVKFLSRGSISFPTLQQFFTGQYSSISYEPPTTNLTESTAYNTFGFYVQDDVRATSRVTLNLGLRYEFATTPYGPNNNVYSLINPVTAQPPNYGVLGAPFSNAATHHNFSPRIGFAWDVFGNGKTAVRGGGGIYYDVGNQGQLMAAVNYDTPPRTYDYGFTSAVTNPLSTVPVGEGLLDQFTLDRNGCADISNPLKTPCTIAGVNYFLQQPSRGQWNLTIDQQLPWQMDLAVSYVGSVGWHLWTQLDQNYENATILANGTYSSAVQTDSRGEPVYCVAAANGECAFAQPGVALPQGQTVASLISGLAFHRVNPTLGESDWETAIGRAWYHSLQVVLNKRVSNGLQFQNAFTWAKNMDTAVAGALGDSSIDAVVPTGPNLHSLVYDNGPSGYNIALNDRFNTIYHFGNLSGNGILEKFTNGWWTSAIITAQSGYPFTPTIGGSTRLLGVSQIGSEVPNYAPTYNHSTVIVGKQTEWFDPTQFSLPVAGTNGDVGRNFLNGPGLFNTDFSLVKDTKVGWLGEAGSLQFRAEVFNLFNRANFGLPSGSLYSLAGGATQATLAPGQFVPTSAGGSYAVLPAAGVISSTVTTSRQIQFALKVIF